MHVIQQPLILLMLHLCYTLATLVLHSCYTQTGDLTNVKQPPLYSMLPLMRQVAGGDLTNSSTKQMVIVTSSTLQES